MLAIWSRARQNPGTCRCVSCVSNVTALARRGAQAGIRDPRAFRMPTSTFVYTAMFTAGLAIDARAKAARNRQWEEAFAHLREALDRPLPEENVKQISMTASERSTRTRGYHGVPLEDLPGDLDWDAIQRIVGMELVDDHVLREQEVQSQINDLAQTAWDELSFDSRLPGAQSLEWPANTGRNLVRYHLPPQSLWAPDSLRWTAMRRRHTWKKLAIQELSTGLLLHTLMARINILRYRQLPACDLLSPQLWDVASLAADNAKQARRDILDSIEKLQQMKVNSSADEIAKTKIRVNQPAIPSYCQDADGDFYDTCQQMNRGIKQILSQKLKGDDRREALAVAKICHNLLVSTAPPDLQTFNILISGFKRWGRPTLVDDVIAAFYAHKIRPNEITCREILGHYTWESRPEHFSRFVAKMRGVGDALMLADPHININEASQDRLVRVREDKVFQKVHPTPMVFGALIDGVMKFAGFDRALDIYYEMKADGWGLDVHGLTKLLGDCIRRADWEGGIYVWEEINIIKPTASPRDMTKAYHHMLSLCSVTGNTIAFNQVLNDVAKSGFDRKSIITAATKTTHWAQKKREYLAPAWAADNVLIAVSDYVRDANTPDLPVEVEASVKYDDMLIQDPHLAVDTMDDEAIAQIKQHEQDPVDPKAAWASWVEHEFGERPKDPKP